MTIIYSPYLELTTPSIPFKTKNELLQALKRLQTTRTHFFRTITEKRLDNYIYTTAETVYHSLLAIKEVQKKYHVSSIVETAVLILQEQDAQISGPSTYHIIKNIQNNRLLLEYSYRMLHAIASLYEEGTDLTNFEPIDELIHAAFLLGARLLYTQLLQEVDFKVSVSLNLFKKTRPLAYLI